MNLRLLDTEEFPYGPGLFETIRLEDGTPALLEEHWNRLSTSCRELQLLFPWSFEEVRRTIFSLRGRDEEARAKPPGRMRLIYKNGQGGPVLSIQFLKPKPIPASWSLLPITVTPHPLAPHKTTDRRSYEVWHEKALSQGASDALFVTDHGDILETSRANIFLVINQELRTPAPDGRILPGIMRDQVIQLAKKLKIPLHEAKTTKKNLAQAVEIFITNSVLGVLEVSEIIGLWRNESPCESVTSKLQTYLSRVVRPTLLDISPMSSPRKRGSKNSA